MVVMKIFRGGKEVGEVKGYKVTHLGSNSYSIEGEVPALLDVSLSDTSEEVVLKEIDTQGKVLRIFDKGIRTRSRGSLIEGTLHTRIDACESEPESVTD